MRGTALRNQETETSCEQRPCHLWESEQQQASTSESIDGPNGGPSEDKVNETEAEGGDEGLTL